MQLNRKVLWGSLALLLAVGAAATWATRKGGSAASADPCCATHGEAKAAPSHDCAKHAGAEALPAGHPAVEPGKSVQAPPLTEEQLMGKGASCPHASASGHAGQPHSPANDQTKGR